MKAIMYHYVRPSNYDLPYSKYLHVDDFVKQLDYFGNVFGFTNKEDFQESISSAKPSTGVVLTFDDGFKDHYHYVLPKLLEYGLWGIFYIPISPLLTDKLIDVHRIHQLIGKHGGKTIADALQGILTKDMLSHERVKEFQSETYKKQNNDSSTNYVKRALNYFIDYRYRENVIEQLMSDFYPNESDLTHNFYMTSAELEHMHNSGMVLGSHTVNHPVMSKISIDDQKREIMQSFDMIESITGEIALKTFCYPYGGFHTFTSQTERLLEENGCLFSFNVESRDINQEDLINRRQALPRFNCNEFPYGSRR